jgi:hypothetical protein
MRSCLLGVIALILTVAAADTALGQPTSVSYQGLLFENGTAYSGDAEFKFAILSGTETIWSNDGTTSGEPASSVTLSVTDGLFDVLLGAPPMNPLTPGALQGVTDAVLRVWVDTGDGFSQLTDQPIASSAFALASDDDWVIDGDNVYRPSTSGFVGIGTDTPATRLDVVGALSVRGVPGGFPSPARFSLWTAQGARLLQATAGNGSGKVNLFSEYADTALVELDAAEGADNASSLRMRNPNGAITVELRGREAGSGGGGDNAGIMYLYTEGVGNPMISLDAQEGDGSIARFRDTSGREAITLDTSRAADGASIIRTDVLQIRGADVAEQFDVWNNDKAVEPGMVVVIDPAVPGRLSVSRRAYDPGVAGIVSGAGGVRPGMLMGQEKTVADGSHPVAMAGRVYCWADASHGAISPGDLLTTSDTPGHAQKAADRERARGATLGKAMTGLAEGEGLVLVLVMPQ